MKLLSLAILALQTLGVSADELPRRGALGMSFTPVPAAQASQLGLKPGEGLIAQKPAPGLTGAAAGIAAGDVVLTMNGEPVVAQKIGARVRETKPGTELKFEVIRDGKKLTLQAALVEKPRDPGGKNYEVIYSHIVSHGKRMRTIITKPRTSGKHPGFMFIQGFSPVSYDYILETAKGDVASLDGPLLFDFANNGYVTIRVEKPGVGDSEGGPFAEMDYNTEIDIYRQTLKQLKELSEVDAESVFIFGHSMGGAFGPMIAAVSPVKGIAVYGVAARTWFEYLLDTVRYQGLVGGDTFEHADEVMRQSSALLSLVMLHGKSPVEVKKSNPELAQLADEFFPGGLFNGKSLDFWRQLQQTNFASYWAKLDTHVLAAKGQADFVVYEADHKLIADIVNRAHPGKGTFAIVPSSDHLFHSFSTEQESMRNFQRGTYTPAFSKMMMEWIEKIRKGG